MKNDSPKCPHCGKAINVGSIMGKRNLGRTKQFTEEQREMFRQNLANARKNRWTKEQEPATTT